tara:strand:+ start:643 stop:876 length:234 start_codon:yes stop_codon:yes gene_type:complete
MNKKKILDSRRIHIKCDNCGHEDDVRGASVRENDNWGIDENGIICIENKRHHYYGNRYYIIYGSDVDYRYFCSHLLS